MIHEARIRHLIGVPPRDGSYVLYWMQQAQRTEYNHALAFAAQTADELDLPLVVGFVLTPDFPEANLRHYQFMLEGIRDVQAGLDRADIPFVLRMGEMVASVVKLAEKAAWVVTDVGYLRIQREWRDKVAKAITCPFTAVETDVIVPVAVASEKEETAARTLRPKVLKRKDEFFDPVPAPRGRGLPAALPDGISEAVDPARLLSEISVDAGVSPVSAFKGGQQAAKVLLNRFIGEKLTDYETLARDPVAQCQSDLSPYLHFGQISPIAVYQEVSRADAPDTAKWAFLEQLLVRRELGINFVYHNPGYDSYESAVPQWAQKSLKAHQSDPRPYVYTRDQFEAAETHDPYWNAAQMEMMVTGKMHNYMRMYWGKKIIEWTKDPAEAFDIMLYLNNKYELDGRDANSFTGVAWCFGKHDRPWQEREIFGKVRYMNARGLERKFKIAQYVDRVNSL
ncbi:MAG: deoxyribodipyrimidine photo-lyase [Desulfobacterales bacterium]|nr:deoxyribodipyrimidine photo-lyase [Desulfobacterales bacterium]